MYRVFFWVNRNCPNFVCYSSRVLGCRVITTRVRTGHGKHGKHGESWKIIRIVTFQFSSDENKVRYA